MLDKITLFSITLAVFYSLVGFSFFILTLKKHLFVRKTGAKEFISFENISWFFIPIFAAIVLLFWGLWIQQGEFNQDKFLWTTLLIIVQFGCLFGSVVFVGEWGNMLKGYTKMLLSKKGLSNYFGDILSQTGGGLIRADYFKSAFGFSPLENADKYLEFSIREDADEKMIMNIAKVFHQWVALRKMLKQLPPKMKMSPQDTEKTQVFFQQADELYRILRESAPFLKACLAYNETAHYTASELKALRKFRNIPILPAIEKKFVHPTLEALIQVQTDPNVSASKKEEAKQLEIQVREILEKEKVSDSLTADEMAQVNIQTVKSFLGIK